MPTYGGFSPAPSRGSRHLPHEGARASPSQGLDRDRAADARRQTTRRLRRRGARPFNLEETQRLYLSTAASAPCSTPTS